MTGRVYVKGGATLRSARGWTRGARSLAKLSLRGKRRLLVVRDPSAGFRSEMAAPGSLAHFAAQLIPYSLELTALQDRQSSVFRKGSATIPSRLYMDLWRHSY